MTPDTRCCKFCGIEFSKVRFGNIVGDFDCTFNEGYCCKFHRKDHEKQLIKEGKLEPIRTFNFGIMKDTKYRDSRGELIHFPSDGRPYYDRALQKTFYSKKQKAEYMKEKKLVMDGSSDFKRKPIESGDALKKVR